MAEIPFQRAFDCAYGEPERLSPRIRRVVARNPGPFTFRGTGTYIVGSGAVAVIDPGPADAEHIRSILRAVAGETITHVLVTHTHLDHSPGCRLLAAHCDAPTYGFGPHGGGADAAGAAAEEGADRDFAPDVAVADGDRLTGGDWSIDCIHTPGHTSNHMCYALREERALFTGDHVMAWSTSVISPPDGDMGSYMASLERLLARDDAIYWPTHGPCAAEPQALVRALLAHRRRREEEIRACLRRGTRRIGDMVAQLYAGTPRTLHPAAERSVLATLAHLVERGEAACEGEPALDSAFRLGTRRGEGSAGC